MGLVNIFIIISKRNMSEAPEVASMRFKISDFKYRHAYIIQHEDGGNLEFFEDIQDHVTAAKELCKWLGFDNSEIEEGDEYDDIGIDGLWVPLSERANKNKDDKTLIFLYYKGHANVMNGQIRAVGSMDEGIELESFLRDCSSIENIYCIGLFDCCRRERGRGGIYTTIDECYNIACIYREECH